MKRFTEQERSTWIQEQMDALIADAPVKVFAASNSPIIPFRLSNAKNYRPNHAYRSREFILDSGIGHGIGNDEVIEAALKLDSTVNWIVPKDYPNDRAKTIASLRDFKSKMPASFEGKLLIPIQGSDPADYVECLKEARAIFPDENYFGIGGIAGAELTTIPELKSLSSRIRLVEHILGSIKSDERVHLFGCTSTQWISVYGHSCVVSCDSARFGQQAKYGGLTGKHGGVVSYYAIANQWIQFLMEITNPQNPTNQASFTDIFG